MPLVCVITFYAVICVPSKQQQQQVYTALTNMFLLLITKCSFCNKDLISAETPLYVKAVGLSQRVRLANWQDENGEEAYYNPRPFPEYVFGA